MEGGRWKGLVHFQRRSVGTSIIARSGADGGQTVVGARVSERVEEWKASCATAHFDGGSR
jgi:hypothetical protein